MLLEHRVLLSLIQQSGAKIVAELGVWQGELAELMLKECDIDEYYGIDPYSDEMTYAGGAMSMHIAGLEKLSGIKNLWHLIYLGTKDRLKDYKNCQLIRKKAEDAVSQFPDEYFDLIYFDGDHTYDVFKKDLLDWMPKIKKGGVLCGHDYGAVYYKDVQRVVDEVLPNRDILEGKTWIMKT